MSTFNASRNWPHHTGTIAGTSAGKRIELTITPEVHFDRAAGRHFTVDQDGQRAYTVNRAAAEHAQQFHPDGRRKAG